MKEYQYLQLVIYSTIAIKCYWTPIVVFHVTVTHPDFSINANFEYALIIVHFLFAVKWFSSFVIKFLKLILSSLAIVIPADAFPDYFVLLIGFIMFACTLLDNDFFLCNLMLKQVHLFYPHALILVRLINTLLLLHFHHEMEV